MCENTCRENEGYDMENNETKETISARRTILVVEDVESNFLLLKAIIGKIYTLLHADPAFVINGICPGREFG